MFRHTRALIRLWRNSHKDTPLTKNEIQTVSRALLALQRGLTGERNLAGAGYMDRRESLGAYLLYYFPVSYEQIRFALASFIKKSAICEKPEIRILDVGSGPGPASAAAVDTLIKIGVPVENLSLTLVDSSEKALHIAKAFFKFVYPTLRVVTRLADFETAQSLSLQGSYNLILAGHVVNELWKNLPERIENRARWIRSLSEHLAKDGSFLICEPALLNTSRDLIQLATELTYEELYIVAPCPEAINGTHKCPIFAKGLAPTASCHAELVGDLDTTVLAIAQAAGLTRESVKMTFFAFSKTEPQCPTQPQFRVVSDAMLNKSGRVRVLLCDGKARVALSAKENDAHAREEKFFDLTRYDRIALVCPEIRGEKDHPAYGIAPDTHIQITQFAPETAKKAGSMLQAKSRARKTRRTIH